MLLVVLLMVTEVKAGLLDSVAGGWSFGFTGFVPPRGCELYVGGHNPGFAIMGVGGSDLSGVGGVRLWVWWCIMGVFMRLRLSWL